MKTEFSQPQSYDFKRNPTITCVGEMFEAYYIGEINDRLSRLLKIAVGSPLFIEQPPNIRAELVGDTVSIMRYLDFLAAAYEAERERNEAMEQPENKD